ncbi:hypothetical protein BDR06DRAFT_979972 [Suillus hirtellus]|nr:hypothetical protein BDR06DRAFT_979972 [Suillus hirtellus]
MDAPNVWKDIEIMTLPSNIATTPKAIGSARHGKLSADQCNFMDLVTATKLASMRQISTEQVNSFHFHMLCYLQNLLDLYHGITMTPNQHLSIHLADLFSSWGLAHAWRCFPFEHFNYKLQIINTNMMFGFL